MALSTPMVLPLRAVRWLGTPLALLAIAVATVHLTDAGPAGPSGPAAGPMSVDASGPSPIWREDVVFPIGTAEQDALAALGPLRLHGFELEFERELVALAPVEIAGELSGVRVRIGCSDAGAPDDGRCPLGTARAQGGWRGTIRLSPVALNLTDEARRALLAHELAHLWQHQLTGTHVEPVVNAQALALPADTEPVRTDVALRPIELEADCIAQLWGHPWPETVPYAGYWRCSDPALAAVSDVWDLWRTQR
jgi:hypothetical protein